MRTEFPNAQKSGSNSEVTASTTCRAIPEAALLRAIGKVRDAEKGYSAWDSLPGLARFNQRYYCFVPPFVSC